MINVTNASALDSGSVWPKCMATLNTAITTTSDDRPCRKLKASSFLPKSDSAGFLGGRFIMFFSAGSDSNTTEQVGSIISSRKTICIG